MTEELTETEIAESAAPEPVADEPVVQDSAAASAPVDNAEVLAMIDTVRARLDDLEYVVRQAPMTLEGYAAKVDDLDTRVYVMQTKIEDLSARFEQGEDVFAAESGETSRYKIPEGVKEGMTDAVQSAAELARDVKPVVSEITGTVNELKEAFGITGKIKTPFKR